MPPSVPTCPDCGQPLTPQNTVILTVTIDAGDDACGQASSTRVPVCGGCGTAVSNRYAKAAQLSMAQRG